MIDELKLLCEQITDTTFTSQEKKVAGNKGSYIFITTYFINVRYKKHLIEISNEFGNHNLGKVQLKLNDGYISPFEITSIDHFTNFFLRRKDTLSIKCKNKIFKDLIYTYIVKSGLQEIAKENSFEPKIQLTENNDAQYIKTHYSLQFKNKLGAIKALINFHKLIIDHIQ